MFDFNNSLNDVAPLSPMSFPVDVMSNEKSVLLVDAFNVSFFFLFSQVRSSRVSVVFSFNASLNDVAPFSPISFPVDVIRKEKSELLMDVFCVSSFFCLHHSDRVSRVLRLFLMIHSMMLLLCLRSCYLLM